MTRRNRNPCAIVSARRRRLVAEFSGGSITSDAGLLLLREADRQIGWLDALNAVIPDPSHPGVINYPQRMLLA